MTEIPNRNPWGREGESEQETTFRVNLQNLDNAIRWWKPYAEGAGIPQ